MTPGARALFCKNANIADWMRGDGEGVDWRYALLGAPALDLATQPILSQYSKRVMRPLAGAPVNAAERQLMRNLQRQQGTHNASSPRAASIWNRNAKPADKRTFVSRLPQGSGQGSHYNLSANVVGLAKGQRGPGILAHELGHAAGGKNMIRANLAGKHLPGLGAITALASSDQNTSGAAAALGTLGGLSTLTSELDASRRGFKMLRGAGGSRAQALKAFIGVPTYALSTAMPWLAYKGKEMMGGFKTKQAGLPSRQLWTLLASAKKLRGSMGSDTADRFISGHTGSGLKPSLSQFFSRPEVQGLGIHKRTPAKKILALLAASKTPTPALPKNTKLVQAELPGFGGLAKTPPPR